MITYDENKRIFHLHNKNVSYYIYVNKAGYLETLYFGKYLSEIEDTDFVRRAYMDNGPTQYYDTVDKVEKTYEDLFKANYSRQEISTHGKIDKRGAPIVIKRPSGSTQTVFTYVSHRVYEGIECLKGLPHALGNKKDVTTLEITLKEALQDVYVVYYLSLYNDCDILIKNYKIINKEKHNVKILRALSMQLDLNTDQYSVVHFPGRWAKEREYVENDIHDGVQEVASNYGRSSHEENPFVYLRRKEKAYGFEEVIGFNLIYSGNFLFRIFNDSFRAVHITYGINDEDFEWVLEPNDEFVTPQAVISYSVEGVDKMSQNFHYFIKNHLITYKRDREYKEILFNSWEGTHLDFTTESILSYIDDSTKIGSELFVLDDGWFGRRNNEIDGLGDWYINEKKIDLKRVIDRCHERNLKFGIWFEPEMVNPLSDLYLEHPEYAICDETRDLNLGRHQFVLDFSNPEVVENIYQQMIKVIDKYDIDYIKWDHNRSFYEHFSRYLDAEHQGEVYHRNILGYYDLLSRLIERYPHIMFEGCASGGGRFDLGTLFYTPQIWTSDESDPIQRIYIQYNTSLGYPLSTMGAHVNANKITSYETKACIALFGTYGYEMNPNKLNEDEIKELNKIAEIYKKYHSKVIQDGTLYHLLSPEHTNFMCMESVSKDKTQALVILVNKVKETEKSRFILLKGLDPNKKYYNSYNEKVYSGAYYMQIGLNFSYDWFDEFSCRLIVIEER